MSKLITSIARRSDPSTHMSQSLSTSLVSENTICFAGSPVGHPAATLATVVSDVGVVAAGKKVIRNNIVVAFAVKT
jgi:hypothetical protein